MRAVLPLLLLTLASCSSADRGERVVPKDPTVRPGSLSGVTCGSSTADEVRANFGTDAFEEHADASKESPLVAIDYTRWPDGKPKAAEELDAIRPSRVLFAEDGTVLEIELHAFNRPLTTEEGIGPGSSRETVERAFGPAKDDAAYEDAKRGYAFTFERGRVTILSVRKPAAKPAPPGAAPIASATDIAKPLGPDRKPLGRAPVVVAEHGVAGVVVAFAANGTKVFSGGANGVESFDLAKGERARLAATDERVAALAVSVDGRLLATSASASGIVVHDARTREVVARPSSASVVALAFAPDSRTLSAASSKELALIDVGSWTTRVRVASRADFAAVAFSPDGTVIAVADGTSARLIETATGHEVATLAHDSPVTAVAFARDGFTVVTGTRGGGCRAWDPSSGRSLAKLGDEHATVHALAFAPDGEVLVLALDGGLAVWATSGSPSSWTRLRTSTLWGEPRALGPSPGGKLLAVATSTGHVFVGELRRDSGSESD